jgi:hypothetical protein
LWGREEEQGRALLGGSAGGVRLWDFSGRPWEVELLLLPWKKVGRRGKWSRLGEMAPWRKKLLLPAHVQEIERSCWWRKKKGEPAGGDGRARLHANMELAIWSRGRGRPWLLGEIGMEKLLAAVMREEEGAPCSCTFGGSGGRREGAGPWLLRCGGRRPWEAESTQGGGAELPAARRVEEDREKKKRVAARGVGE